eukprot:TRINITY_DN3207_c0_g1_i1.p1 TRINITY_DN3207_c0_g1~~TRINITY_DN3207_c0_g1_i1.p1  ORF type:complete len:113 (+),score=24.25 TRINITY_DN3207_c0_g1_i1:416-754(+)
MTKGDNDLWQISLPVLPTSEVVNYFYSVGNVAERRERKINKFSFYKKIIDVWDEPSATVTELHEDLVVPYTVIDKLLEEMNKRRHEDTEISARFQELTGMVNQYSHNWRRIL